MIVARRSVQATFCATLVDEWVRAGVRHAVVCPGSRSTPLALALAADGRLQVTVRLDERSAGFSALGIGLASGQPAVVCVTSGTAAAELHPAVVEAHHAHVPLLVCTADRPPELHHVGAPQTIDQTRLYGPAVRWWADPGVPDPATAGTWRSLAARAVAETLGNPAGPGPVQLNLALRDPLVGEPGELPPGRPGGAPWHRLAAPAGGDGDRPRWRHALAPVLEAAAGRGLLVAGAGAGHPEAVLAAGEALGWPVLADPRSGCRLERPGVVAHADALLRDPELAGQLQPEVVVTLGRPWASKVLAGFVAGAAGAGATVMAVDPHAAWLDPDRLAASTVVADPSAWCRALVEAVPAAATAHRAEDAPATWSGRWGAADAAAADALRRWCAEQPGLTEPCLARLLVQTLPPSATLVAASSMPVRDVEWYAPARARPPRVVANRGANGIDGVVSTAIGVALACGPSVALVGDLAFLHDLSALVRVDPRPVACTVVVADNGGGGIFSFLPQAQLLDQARFETLFGTAPLVDVAEAAGGLGIPTTEVGDAATLVEGLRTALGCGRLSVLRARLPDRGTNASLHDDLHRAMAAAARSALASGG